MGYEPFHHVRWRWREMARKMSEKSGEIANEQGIRCAPTSWTRTSTSTTSKPSGKLTLSGCSMHPSPSTVCAGPGGFDGRGTSCTQFYLAPVHYFSAPGRWPSSGRGGTFAPLTILLDDVQRVGWCGTTAGWPQGEDTVYHSM